MLISFGVCLILFLIIVEIASVLFRLTGLQEDKARFQVISILTGTGFTTRESELVTQHPTRRRLAQAVMILGYVGLGTYISFLINILKYSSFKDFAYFFALSVVTILTLRNKHVLIIFDKIIEKIVLSKRLQYRSKINIYSMLSQNNGYGLYHILVEANSFLDGVAIKDSTLKEDRIQIINIDKGHKLIDFPTPDYVIEKGDNLLVYGEAESIVSAFNIR